MKTILTLVVFTSISFGVYLLIKNPSFLNFYLLIIFAYAGTLVIVDKETAKKMIIKDPLKIF